MVSEPELLGQKLTAVAYRAAPRDLFDMDIMLKAGWHRNPSARAMYLSYSFLQGEEWHRLSYPVQLDVRYEPAQLTDVLRGESTVPTLKEIRAAAERALEQDQPSYTHATDHEQALRRAILGGDLGAFADLAGQPGRTRRSALAKHPGLAWRLQQARRHGAREHS